LLLARFSFVLPLLNVRFNLVADGCRSCFSLPVPSLPNLFVSSSSFSIKAKPLLEDALFLLPIRSGLTPVLPLNLNGEARYVAVSVSIDSNGNG
jgi:hypothetical protein